LLDGSYYPAAAKYTIATGARVWQNYAQYPTTVQNNGLPAKIAYNPVTNKIIVGFPVNNDPYAFIA
jgi:hypothetical protein